MAACVSPGCWRVFHRSLPGYRICPQDALNMIEKGSWRCPRAVENPVLLPLGFGKLAGFAEVFFAAADQVAFFAIVRCGRLKFFSIEFFALLLFIFAFADCFHDIAWGPQLAGGIWCFVPKGESTPGKRSQYRPAHPLFSGGCRETCGVAGHWTPIVRHHRQKIGVVTCRPSKRKKMRLQEQRESRYRSGPLRKTRHPR